MVTWEAITAISTAVTTIVLVLTVIMGRRQLELLRRSTQLDGLIKTLGEMDEPRYVESYHFVLHELAGRMQDPAFRELVARGGVTEVTHQYMPILTLFERMGAYVRYGLLDADTVYCQAGARAVRAWEKLREVVEIDRMRAGPGVWDSFEALCEGATRYARKMNPNYPGPYKGESQAAEA